VLSAIPPTIRAAAKASERSTGSPSRSAAVTIPTIGVAVVPSDVVKAGRLLLTIDIAQ
jgi:hypothetical protein